MKFGNLCDSVYLADGNNNVVLRVNKAPYILRFAKKDPPFFENHKNDQGYKQSKIHSCEDITRFYSMVVRNVLPADYLMLVYETIKPDTALMAHVVNEFRTSRDARRADCMIQTDCVLIMDDITRLFELNSDVFSVEIKPKMGFIPTSHVSPHYYESKYCRFCLQQISGVKKDIYDVKESNLYCPLDLYSDCHNRIKDAIRNLFNFPQNNLKLFKNGLVINFQDWTNYQFLQELFFKCIIEDSNKNIPVIKRQNLKICQRSKLLDCCLSGSCKHKGPGGVLNSILKLQTYWDSGQCSIFKLWESFSEERKKLAVEVLNSYDHEIWRNLDTTDICPLNDQEISLVLLRNFLLSMTFRDVSLIFSLKEKKGVNILNLKPDHPYILHEDILYEYCIKIIDTDPKSPQNIPYYYHQSLNIYHTFLKNMGFPLCDQSCLLSSVC